MVIAGYALLFGGLVEPEILAELGKVGDAPDGIWARGLRVDRNEDGAQTKWTLWTADRHYAELLATKAGRVELSRDVAREKFPAFQRGWVIDDGQLNLVRAGFCPTPAHDDEAAGGSVAGSACCRYP